MKEAIIIVKELNKLLQEKPIAAGIKLHHLLQAIGCNHSTSLRKLSRIEDKLVRDIGYQNIIDLIKARKDAAEALLQKLQEAHSSTIALLEEHCSNSLSRLRDIIEELQEILAQTTPKTRRAQASKTSSRQEAGLLPRPLATQSY